MIGQATREERPMRVEVWLRDLGLSPDDPRRAVLRRLRELEEAGAVADVSVRTWGKSIPVGVEGDDRPGSDDPTSTVLGASTDSIPGWVAGEDGTVMGRPEVRARVAEFRSWARRTGRSLEPAFCTSKRTTVASDEATGVVHLPMQCLAVYDGDRLLDVYPCTAREGPKTVRDGLRALEESMRAERPGAGAADGSATSQPAE